MELKKFEENIDCFFQHKELLKTALTHTSYAYENHIESNEKLEFLGDAILEFVISKYLFLNYKKLKEGEMTKVRATVVCEDSLYEVAKKHQFNEFIYLGKSESTNKMIQRKAILADAVEAVIAAIYMDLGLEKAEKFILDNLKDAIEVASKHVGMKDHKTILQEKLQQNGEVKIEYNLLEESGPDHDKLFKVEVRCDGKFLAIGEGKTKKSAQMQAAKKALEHL